MTNILQIETATTACSVALASNGNLLASRTVNQRNIHAEVLTLYIDDILKHAGLGYADIDAVAVSSGPGSYTGLRIGVSTAKGLCYALDKPLIAVETLQAMAGGLIATHENLPADALLCPMIDARRMEVYRALFTAQGQRARATAADIIDENSFADALAGNKVIFFGDGAAKCEAVLGHHSHALFIADFTNNAAWLTQAALAKFNASEFEDVAYFEPFYLKDFIAGKKSL